MPSASSQTHTAWVQRAKLGHNKDVLKRRLVRLHLQMIRRLYSPSAHQYSKNNDGRDNDHCHDWDNDKRFSPPPVCS